MTRNCIGSCAVSIFAPWKRNGAGYSPASCVSERTDDERRLNQAVAPCGISRGSRLRALVCGVPGCSGARPDQHALEIARPFGFPVTNSMVVTWIVAALLIVFARRATRNMKRVPDGAQNFLEFSSRNCICFSRESSVRTL